MTGFAAITGWGKCVPPAVLTNDEIATVFDTSDEWIRTRSGIRERRVSHVPGSDLAAVAAQRAMAAADINVDDVDLLIVATCTPDTVIPTRTTQNWRIIESLAKHLAVDMSKVEVNIQNYDNTSAATIPVALVEALEILDESIRRTL